MLAGSPSSPLAWEPDELLALALSRPPEALAAAREVLAQRPPPSLAAVAHQAAGVVLRDFGDIGAAIGEFRQARRLAHGAGDGGRESEVLGSLGVALVLAGQAKRGLSALDTALRGSRGVPAGRILLRRSNALWVLGRSAEALQDARAAVDLLSGSGDPVWEARALYHRAAAYFALGDIERADRDYARTETLYAACGQRLEYASVRHDRGAAAHARGDLPTALAHLHHAQDLFDELGIFAPELIVNKCTVLLAAGLARDALREAGAAVSRIETDRGSATRRAELLYVAALAAAATGDFGLAQQRSADALRLFRRQQRPRWAARADLALLLCRFTAGENSSAGLLQAARRVTGRLEALDAARAVDAHLLTGRIALARGRRDEAARHLRSAANARRRGETRTRSAGWLAQATWYEAEGRWREMLVACDRGLALLDLHLRTLGATELRTLATAQGAELAGIALRHAVRRADPRMLLKWSERWRATVCRVTPVRPAAGGELEADLAALRSVVARLDSAPDDRTAEPALQRERRRLEAAVRQRVLRTPAAAVRDAAPFAVAGLLGELGETDLLELTDVGGELYAVAVTGRRMQLVPVGPTQHAVRAVEHALFALRREGARRGTGRLDLDAIGARLEASLLGESARLLRGGPLVVVPTGMLHAVPWGLMGSLRERPVTVAPSASAWLRAGRAVRPADRKVVLVGGPRLSTGDAEVRRLAALYPDAVVLASGGAVTDKVMAAMDGAWLVHIAAHGTFRADSPLFSAIELDDGPLTVYDLERLNRPPHRVVLSSCSSAAGAAVGADELLGLVSALIALGSAGVVASVVPVSDPATVPLMGALHEHLRAGAGLAEALALARPRAGAGSVARATAYSFIALGA
ncbi:MAG: CHAT domain-containing protein [Streptosporangiaceae bacterium]|nr:CHAT domain-containing protein [Streptosporangiaceae bacterium]